MTVSAFFGECYLQLMKKTIQLAVSALSVLIHYAPFFAQCVGYKRCD